MSAIANSAGDPAGFPAGGSIIGVVLRYAGLIIVDAFAVWLIYALAADQVFTLAAVIALVTIFVNVVNLRPEFYPLRWMSPGLALMFLLVVYPIFFTFYVAFTNYGDGHLFTKVQAAELLARRQYLPEGSRTYSWELFVNEAGEYAIWLVIDESEALFGFGEEPLEDVVPNQTGEGPFDDNGVPATYRGFRHVTENRELGPALLALGSASFGTAEEAVLITRASARNRLAGPSRSKYDFDPQRDGIVDRETGIFYRADNEIGSFVADDGSRLDAGFWVPIGWTNFTRFLGSSALGGPLLQIFVWTIMFAMISVASTFALGLLFALLLNTNTPGKRFFRTILIVPYAIPALIAVAIWKGMLNPNFGVLPGVMSSVGITPPDFFADGNWAKFAILLINLWLGYPYFMLVCSGALASIPSDMYEAAEVDGANVFEQFRFLTIPMLLVAVGPLLIASFTFNFNNYALIEVYNEGRPPIPGAETPAGYTDILITYTYRLAFGGGRGADYGLASAITIIIFMMVAAVTLFQFRFTRRWEEVSENV